MSFDLTNEQICQTYPRLVQIDTSSNVIRDGLGNIINIFPTTASYAITASYALNGGGSGTGGLWTQSLDGSYVSIIGDVQISGSLFVSGSVESSSCAVSASYAISSSYSDYALTASYALNGGGGGLPYLTENTTVNFSSSMDSTQIQALIDAQPKNLNGYILTFQFADGTYTFTSLVSFNNFYSGTVKIQGNMSESLQHTNQAVIFNSNQNICMYVVGNTAIMEMYHIRLNSTVASVDGCCIYTAQCSSFTAFGCYFTGVDNTTSNYSGVWAEYFNNLTIAYTYTSAFFYGLRVTNGCTVIAGQLSETGTIPKYGIGSYSSLVYRWGGTYSSAVTATTITGLGGTISTP